MRHNEHESRIDPRLPALVVVAGRTRKKRRPLDRNIFVLGRASGCDLGLVSSDVAPVHCVIVRGTKGWCIRDCSGRRLTRVNGNTFDETVLRDGDIIQIGSFSFQAYLPKTTDLQVSEDTAPEQAVASQAELQKLQRSRRSLARHALRFRIQLRANKATEAEMAQRREDLERQEERLRNRIRDQEKKSAQLAQERQKLDAARAELERQQAEAIPQRQAEPTHEFQEQVQELERWGVELVRQNTALDRRSVELDRRARELNHFARCLHATKQQLLAKTETPSGASAEQGK
jgi:chromosome segregation ATPase